MTTHKVQIFFGGSFLTPSSWGWQCFTCGAERDGLASEADANKGADKHGERV